MSDKLDSMNPEEPKREDMEQIQENIAEAAEVVTPEGAEVDAVSAEAVIPETETPAAEATTETPVAGSIPTEEKPRVTVTSKDAAAAGAGVGAAEASEKKHSNITRRDVLAMCGCGVAGLVVGGVLATWGVTSKSIASGRIEIRSTPTKMIVTDRAKCSGCQRCEMACTLKNDGYASQAISRVRVGDNYFWGTGADIGEGSFGEGTGACEFTVEHCKQCDDPACMNYCPVHAIYCDPDTGARVVDEQVCIGCGMCSQACPWNMPRVNADTGVSTKCVACGRCADQCPNGAIEFVDWQDIAQKAIDTGVVRTVTLVEEA